MRAVTVSLTSMLLISSVASAQWSEVTRPGSFDHIQMFYVGPEALYAGALSGTVYTSDDHGDSWSSIASGFDDEYAPVQALARVGDTFVMSRAAFGDRNFRSQRDGSSWGPWEPIAFQDASFTMMLVVDASIFGTVDGTLNRSEDAGLTWSPLALPGGDATWDIFTTGSDVCAISGSSIHRSLDGGASWITTSTPLGSTQVSSRIFYEGELLVDVYHGGGVGSLWRSPDHGITWSEVTTVPTTYNLADMAIADDGRLVVGASSNGGGAGSIFFTSDLVTWDDYTADLPWFAQPVIDLHVHDGWLIKTGGSATPYHAPQPLVVGVGEVPGTAAPSLVLEAVPNPARGGARIRLKRVSGGEVDPGAGATAVDVDVAVYDTRGRRVSTLHRGAIVSAPFEYRWDGHDASGHDLPSGVYTIRARAGSEGVQQRITLIR